MKKLIKASVLVYYLIVLLPITCLAQPDFTIVQEIQFYKYPKCTFSPAGKYMAVADSTVFVMTNPIYLLDSKSIVLTNQILVPIYKIRFSPDGKYLAGASKDGNIFIWDISQSDFEKQNTLTHSQKLRGHTSHVYELSFSPDSKYLASGGADSTIIIWDISNWKIIKKITAHRGGISDLTFSPGGTYLASSSSHENFIRVWDVATWAEFAKFNNEDGERGFRKLTFSPDGRYLAGVTSIYSSDRIFIWDIWDMTKIETINPLAWFLIDLKFSPDGRYLIITTIDNQLIVFNTWKWTEVLRRKGKYDKSIDSISFTHDGNYIAFANGDEIFICSIEPPMTPRTDMKIQDKRPSEQPPKAAPKRR